MAESLGDAVLELRTDDKGLERGLKSAKSRVESLGKTLDKVGKSMQALGTKMSLAVTAPLVGLAALSASLADVQIQAERTLGAALRLLTDESADALAGFKEFASGLQEITTIGDEVTLQMSQVAISMGLSAEAAKLAVKDAIGLSAGFGIAANSAIRYTAALASGDTTMLNRYIPTLRDLEDQTERVAKAHEILAGGFDIAIEAAKAGLGPLRQMKNEFGDLLEQVGAIVIEGLIPLIAKLREVIKWAQDLSPETKKLIVLVGGLAAAIGPLLIGLGSMIRLLGFAVSGLGLLVASPAALIIAGITLAVGALAVGLIALTSATSDTKQAIRDYNSVLDESRAFNDRLAESIKSVEEAMLAEALAIRSKLKAQLEDIQSQLRGVFQAQLLIGRAFGTKSGLAQLLNRLFGPELDEKEWNALLGVLDQTEEALRRNQEEIEKLSKAGDNLDKSINSAGSAMTSFGETVADQVIDLSEMSTAFTDNSAAIEANRKGYDLLKQTGKDLGRSQAELTVFVTALKVAVLDGIISQDDYEAAMARLGDTTDAAALSQAEMEEALKALKIELMLGRISLKEYNEALRRLTDFKFTDFVQNFRSGVRAIEQVWQDAVARMADQLVTGIIEGFDDLEAELGEIFAQAGRQLGAAFGFAIGGPIGAGIGAALGDALGKAVGKFLGRLFGGGSTVLEKLLRVLDLQLSKGLQKMIETLSRQLGNAAVALRQFLGDVIREVGIETAQELRKFLRLTLQILGDLNAGVISSAEAVNALGDSLSEILDRFEEAGGTIAELNQIVDVFMNALDQVRRGQLSAAQATEILNANFGQFIDIALTLGEEGVEAIKRVVDAAREAGVEAEVIALRLRETIDEVLRVMEERNRFLIAQSRTIIDSIERLFSGVGKLTRKQIKFAAAAALQAFASMQEAGLSILVILDELGEVFGQIAERGEELGIELPAGFERLGEILEIVGRGPIQRFLGGLEAMAAAAQAVGNMGLLSAEQFDIFGDEIDKAFRKLIRQGLSSEEALALLAPQLQLLNDLSQQYGFELDANTQKLIDQAKEQGLVADKGLTTEDILIRGFDRMLEALNALIVALGGVAIEFGSVGDAAEAAADQGVAAANQTADAWEDAADRALIAWGRFELLDGGRRGIERPGFQHGTGGFLDFGAGTPAILHGREQVVTAQEGASVAAMVASVIRSTRTDPAISDDDSGRGLESVRQEVEALRFDLGTVARSMRSALAGHTARRSVDN